MPVHPLFQVRLQELEHQVEHGLGVLLNVLDAEQSEKKEGYFFSFFVLERLRIRERDEKRNGDKLFCIRTKHSLDDVVGLREHLQERDLAEGRGRDALLLHLFCFSGVVECC